MADVRLNLGGAVFGLIVIGSLIAAESATHETYAESIAASALSALVYWSAHAYGELTARRVRKGERLTVSGIARAMSSEASILWGAAVPLLVLAGAWAAGASLNTGINAALVSVAASIVAVEMLSAVRAKLGGRELALQTLFGVALGLLVLAIHQVLH